MSKRQMSPRTFVRRFISPDDEEDEIQDIQGDEAMTRRALELLGSLSNDRYEAALDALREDTREWWADMLARGPDKLEEEEEPFAADPEGLRRLRRRRCCRGSRSAGRNWPTAR
jgi:hypothetical protein